MALSTISVTDEGARRHESDSTVGQNNKESRLHVVLSHSLVGSLVSLNHLLVHMLAHFAHSLACETIND